MTHPVKKGHKWLLYIPRSNSFMDPNKYDYYEHGDDTHCFGVTATGERERIEASISEVMDREAKLSEKRGC